VSSDKTIAQPLFVHLSDIHFDAKDGVLPDANTAAREMLLDDLRLCAERLGTPDAVLVTGDIAFSGQAHEYVEATRFLERVTAVLGIERGKVQVVPGNHDVDRGRVIGSVRTVHADLRSKSGASLQHALEEYLRKDPTDPLFATMEEYQEFATQYECKVDGGKPFWDTRWRLGAEASLVMRGLTTSMVSNWDDDKANLIVGTIQTSIAALTDNPIGMTLGHHSTDWWKDGDEAGQKLRNYVSLKLWGHKHEFDATVTNDCLEITAGAVNPERDSAWFPKYNWIRLVLLDEFAADPHLQVEYWPRAIDPTANEYRSAGEAGGWTADVRTLPLKTFARRRPKLMVNNVESQETSDDGPFEAPVVSAEAQEAAEEAERTAVVEEGGELSRSRVVLYSLSRLGFVDRQRLLIEFDLLKESDRTADAHDVLVRAVRDIAERGRLQEFSDAVAALEDVSEEGTNG
jgi:predicted phosphodiesterase